MNDCVARGFPRRKAVNPFSANPKSKSSRTDRTQYKTVVVEGWIERTVPAVHGELFTDFGEIRASNETDGHSLSELAEEFDHLWGNFLSER